MHLPLRPAGTIDDGNAACDLDQSPADLVILTAADTEISAFSAAARHISQEKGGSAPPSLAMANLLALSHPYSIDLYCSKTVASSKFILLRLLGGSPYWRYGVEKLRETARRNNIPFAAIAGEAVWDEELAAYSTLKLDDCRKLWRYCVEGGVENLANALRYSAQIIGQPHIPKAPQTVPRAGLYWPGIAHPVLDDLRQKWSQQQGATAAIVFYRALLDAGQSAPINLLIERLAHFGMNALPIYAVSLKEKVAAAFIEDLFAQKKPDIVINCTGFALAKTGQPHMPTILDRPGAPVLQALFSSSSRQSWVENPQGLAARDLAMHVVLPEIDGRLLTRALSFKEPGQLSRFGQCMIAQFVPEPSHIDFLCQLAAAQTRLATNAPKDKKVAILLANYPNRDGRIANGVGLDTPESCIRIVNALAAAGYNTGAHPASGAQLMKHICAGPTNALDEDIANIQTEARLPLSAYQTAFANLPQAVRQAVEARWGRPQDDPKFYESSFVLALHRFGNIIIGIQPARGYNIDPKATYHDPALVPPHHYFATYFWLRHQFKMDAVIHLGKHGNLEWLPGKALALSDECYPQAILGPVPNIYPFIVNDPGEGAQAKRRCHATIIDHLTPPMVRAESHGTARQLETLLDEYFLASGIDSRRMNYLRGRILSLSHQAGFSQDIDMSDAQDDDVRLARLDAHLCDLKEMQIRGGLHIFGTAPEGEALDETLVALTRIGRGGEPGAASLLQAIAGDLALGAFDPLDCEPAAIWQGPRPKRLARLSDDPWRSQADTLERLELFALKLVSRQEDCTDMPQSQAVIEQIEQIIRPALGASSGAEIDGVLHALSGRFVPPGPSGAPTRGRIDVLPTGRNFYSIDIRAVPTQAAWSLGKLSAERLLERHYHDEGEWPKALALSCWGTANMRTGGDDIAQALALIGAMPKWDPGSERVSGFTILSLSDLKRPRIDVTLRVSGFFRDAFPAQIDLFQSAVDAIGALEEPFEANPIRAHMHDECAKLKAEGLSQEEAGRQAAYRVFGSKPGAYGAGLQALIDERIWDRRADLAEAYLGWSGYAYGKGAGGRAARQALERRLGQVEATLHNQDNREHDILDSDDYYQFEGGLAASIEALSGQMPKIYHNDHSRPERPVIRTLGEEIGRVVRGRAANPKWIRAVKRHGYKGAFELAATVDYLFAFAATTGLVEEHHFDQLFDAYINDADTFEFLQRENPAALEEMLMRFDEALERQLWRPKRNSVAELLTQALGKQKSAKQARGQSGNNL